MFAFGSWVALNILLCDTLCLEAGTLQKHEKDNRKFGKMTKFFGNYKLGSLFNTYHILEAGVHLQKEEANGKVQSFFQFHS